jgi:hypothetical protein
VDIDNDRLNVRYDPTRVTPQQMQQIAAKQDFTVTIVTGVKAPLP